MGQIGDAIGYTVPSVNDPGTAYATAVSNILTEVVARLSTQVPLGSLRAGQVGEIFDLNNVGLANAQYVQLYDQASEPSGAPYYRLSVYNGDLYYTNPTGTTRIVAGAALDAGSLSGITGDYGSLNPARLEFDDTSETYRFWDNQAAGEWAVAKLRRLDLVDEASSRSVNVTPNTGITGTYGLQLPPSLPGSGNSLVAIDSSGNLTYADSADITNQPNILGGVLHDDHVVWYPPGHFVNKTNGGSITESGTTAKFTDPDVFGRYFFFQVPVGRRLKGFSARILQSAGSTCTITLARIDDGVASAVAVSGGTNNLVGSAQTVTATVSSPAAAPAARFYRASVVFSGGVTGTYDLYAIAPIYDYV